MMMISMPRLAFFLSLLLSLSKTLGEDGYYDNAYADDDANNADTTDDDGMQSYNDNYANDDGSIKYWTEYALLPKRCIVYNNVDMIVFSLFENSGKQCADEPMGTYIAPVPNFMAGYLENIQQAKEDQGYDDWEAPDVAQYIDCTAFEIENQQFYFQLGCADGTSQALAVNIYSDNTCTNRSIVQGYDDSNIDVSTLKVPFKQCQNCVNWFTSDDVDDMFYENRQTYAPLCSTAWTYKETCGRKCQHTGLEASAKDGWNTSDKILLAILGAFGALMLGLIIRKRQKMSNKDALLEQAAMSAAGLQQPHLVGVFILVVLVIAVFAVLGLKNITWFLLLISNTALFGYLMKLTVDSGLSSGETIIGPDGIMRQNSDDSSVEDASRDSSRRGAGTYMLPVLS